MAQFQELLLKQKVFFHSGATKSFEFRDQMLSKLYHLISGHEEEINQALKSDLGKCSFESYATEVGYTLKEISLIRKKLKSWMKPRFSLGSIVNFFSWGKVFHEPYGQVFIIAPWNYPFQLALSPLLGAIAAGNTAVIKTSELAPHVSKILAKIINENFSPDFIKVVEGAIPETQELLKQPFDYIFFTGSPHVGKVVMKAAAEHLTPLTLELGGKSPCIVTDKANIKVAVKRIAWGKFLNAGQTCVAPDYLYVHEKIHDVFIKALVKEIENFFGQDPSSSSDFGRIVNEKHFERLKKLIIKDRIVIGGETNPEDFYIAPTVLKDISWEDQVMQEEIFGPILPILKFSHIDQVVDEVNKRDKPLALYVFSDDCSEQKAFIQNCSFGGGCINETVVHLAEDHLPFGGVGNSGFGHYHGKQSFLTFSHQKSVLFKPSFLDIPLRYPPYKDKIKLLKMLIK